MSNDYEKLMLLCENVKLSILLLSLPLSYVPPVDLLHPSTHFLTPSYLYVSFSSASFSISRMGS
jgi:hypothetical protein